MVVREKNRNSESEIEFEMKNEDWKLTRVWNAEKREEA
jgi:hypothetical protein